MEFNKSLEVYDIIIELLTYYKKYNESEKDNTITFNGNIVKSIDNLLTEIYIHPLDCNYARYVNQDNGKYYYNFLAVNYTTLKKEFLNFLPVEYKTKYMHIFKLLTPHTRDMLYYRLNNNDYISRIMGGCYLDDIPNYIKKNLNYYFNNVTIPNLHLIFKEWIGLKTTCDRSIYSIYYPVIDNFIKYKEILYNNMYYESNNYDNATATIYNNYYNKLNIIDIINMGDDEYKKKVLNINLNVDQNNKYPYLISDFIFDMNNLIYDDCNIKNIIETIHRDIYYFVYYYDIINKYNILSYFKNYINIFVTDSKNKTNKSIQQDLYIKKIFYYINYVRAIVNISDKFTLNINNELAKFVILFKNLYKDTKYYKNGDINNHSVLLEYFFIKLDLLMCIYICAGSKYVIKFDNKTEIVFKSSLEYLNTVIENNKNTETIDNYINNLLDKINKIDDNLYSDIKIDLLHDCSVLSKYTNLVIEGLNKNIESTNIINELPAALTDNKIYDDTILKLFKDTPIIVIYDYARENSINHDLEEGITNSFLNNILRGDDHKYLILNQYEHHIKKILYRLNLSELFNYNNIEYTHTTFITLLYIIYDNLCYIINSNKISGSSKVELGTQTSTADFGSQTNISYGKTERYLGEPQLKIYKNIEDINITDETSTQTIKNTEPIHHLFWDGIEYNKFISLPISTRNILLNTCIPLILYEHNISSNVSIIKSMLYKEFNFKDKDITSCITPVRLCFIPLIIQECSLYSFYMEVSKHILHNSTIKQKSVDLMNIKHAAYYSFIDSLDKLEKPLQVLVSYTHCKNKTYKDDKKLVLDNQTRLIHINKILDKFGFNPKEKNRNNKIIITTTPGISYNSIENKIKSDPNYIRIPEDLRKLLINNFLSLKQYLLQTPIDLSGGAVQDKSNEELYFENDIMSYINNLDMEYLKIENVDEFMNYDAFIDEKDFYKNKFLNDIKGDDIISPIINNIPPTAINKMIVFPYIEKFFNDDGGSTISNLLDTVEQVIDKPDEFNPMSLILEGLGIKSTPNIFSISSAKEQIDCMLQLFNSYPNDTTLCHVKTILTAVNNLKDSNPIEDDVVEELKENVMEYFKYRYKLYYYMISIAVAVSIYTTLSQYYDKEELTKPIIQQIMDQLSTKTNTYSKNSILSLKNILSSIYKDKTLKGLSIDEFTEQLTTI